MRDLTCPEVTDSAPGFALDILDPATRARVAAHLIRCPECRETVTGMEDSAARLLDVGSPAGWDEPDWDDEPGAEVAVRPGRRRLRVVLSMATAALLIVGTTVGPEVEQAASHPEQPVATVVLASGSYTVGTVRFYGGKAPAVVVDVAHVPASGTLDVVLVDHSGTGRRIGEMELHGGQAGWVGGDPVAPAQLTAVILVDSHRHEVASAPVP